MKISEYREQIDSFIQEKEENCYINAGAGCGKTTTIVENYKRLKEKGKAGLGFCAFNKSIAEELKAKGVAASTIHSLGFSLIRSKITGVKVDERKVNWLISSEYPELKRSEQAYIKRLVSLMKNTLIRDIPWLVMEYQIDLDPVDDRIVNNVFDRSEAEKKIIDFDDMIYLPTTMTNKGKLFETLMVDESQDCNNAQINLIDGTADRYIFVGDKFQSIYGFRGANTEAVEEIKSRFKCKEFILPVSWRCPASHVERVNQLFPEIPFICGRPERAGEIWRIGKSNGEKDKRVNQDNPYREIGNSELILCRCNAPLVSKCFQLIKKRIKATIRGRDIGQGLISLIDKSRQNDISSFSGWLENWYATEMSKLEKANRPTEAVQDKYECMLHLIENTESLIDLRKTIEEIFSDEKGTGVMLSSVHRAKGLENEVIRIIRPDMLPIKSDKADKIQERNIHYVAITRSKSVLIIDSSDQKEK